MKANDVINSNCPVVQTANVLGEGWTLLVLREAFLGTRRFNDFEKRLGVARNILSQRLKTLVETGLLERRPSQEDKRVVEYRLTPASHALLPVLVTMSQWATEWLGNGVPAVRFIERATGEEIPPLQVKNARGDVLHARDLKLIPGPAADAVVQEQYSRNAALRANHDH